MCQIYSYLLVLSVLNHVSSCQKPTYQYQAQVRFSSIHWFLHFLQAPLLLLRPCVCGDWWRGVRIVYLLLLSNRLDVCLFGTGDLSINSFIQL